MDRLLCLVPIGAISDFAHSLKHNLILKSLVRVVLICQQRQKITFNYHHYFFESLVVTFVCSKLENKVLQGEDKNQKNQNVICFFAQITLGLFTHKETLFNEKLFFYWTNSTNSLKFRNIKQRTWKPCHCATLHILAFLLSSAHVAIQTSLRVVLNHSL